MNGYETMEATDNPEDHGPEPNNRTTGERDSYCTGDTLQRPRADGTTQQQVPTTTISTIALQSGDTRLVIALLQVRD